MLRCPVYMPLAVGELKKCTNCHKIKNISEFSKNKRHCDGLQYQCKSCRKELWKDYCQKNKEIINKHKKRYYQKNPELIRKTHDRRYKLTPEQSDFVEYLRVNGNCYICGAKANGKKLHLDHDHKTLVNRGILCRDCNHFEGFLKNQILKGTVELTGKWKDYLENPPGIDFSSLEKSAKINI